MATTAKQVDFLAAGVMHNGKPLSYGLVSTYVAGGALTPIWTASDKGSSATNPIVLDADGKAEVYGDGEYDFVITSAEGTAVITFNNFSVKLVPSNIAVKDGTLQTNLNADLLDSLNTGNAGGNIPISNGTVCTTLNADTVDGVHAAAVAKLSGGNSFSGTQTVAADIDITTGEVFLANTKRVVVRETGGTGRNGVNMNNSNVIQVGESTNALNMNASGGASPNFTINGYALSTFLAPTPKTLVFAFQDWGGSGSSTFNFNCAAVVPSFVPVCAKFYSMRLPTSATGVAAGMTQIGTAKSTSDTTFISDLVGYFSGDGKVASDRSGSYYVLSSFTASSIAGTATTNSSGVRMICEVTGY